MAAWLVDAVAPGRAPRAWENDPDGVPDGLGDAAEQHGVEGWVRRRAQQAGLSLPRVEEAVRAALGRHLRATDELVAARSALDAAGPPFLVVKGPALVEQLYAAPDLRSYVDLDLLVAPGDLGAAVAALEDSGFALLDANWPLLQRARVFELRLIGPAGGAVDLHWSLAKGPCSLDVTPPVEALLDRSVTWQSAGQRVRSLDWADMVVHLAVHAAGSGGHRLLWCADLRAAVERAPENAAELLGERAAQWSAAPQLALMLSRTRSALGTSVPDEWVEALGGVSSWSRCASVVDTLFPLARHGGGRGPTRLVARSTSSTPLDSWRALATKVASAAFSPRDQLDPDWLLDPSDPRSALHPAGGEREREAFFADVARRGRKVRR